MSSCGRQLSSCAGQLLSSCGEQRLCRSAGRLSPGCGGRRAPSCSGSAPALLLFAPGNPFLCSQHRALLQSHLASSPRASRCIIYTVNIDQKMIMASLASQHSAGLGAWHDLGCRSAGTLLSDSSEERLPPAQPAVSRSSLGTSPCHLREFPGGTRVSRARGHAFWPCACPWGPSDTERVGLLLPGLLMQRELPAPVVGVALVSRDIIKSSYFGCFLYLAAHSDVTAGSPRTL